MANYRYLFADLLSNTILGELPMNGVSFQSRLNPAGRAAFSGTVPLGDPIVMAQSPVDITAPRKTALYVDRDGTLVWGGIIWTRRYVSAASGNGEIALTGLTFDSYAYHRWMEGVLPLYQASDGPLTTYTQKDQLFIANELYRIMQGTGYWGMSGNIGIQLDYSQTSGVLRDRTWYGYEQKIFGEAFDQLSAVENGFEYTIDVRYDGNDLPAKYLKLGYPRLGKTGDASPLVFEYPGNILSYAWPEDGTSGANDIYVVGQGEGWAMISSRRAVMEPGYPLITAQRSYKDVKEQNTLDAHAAADLSLVLGNVIIPELTVRADLDPVLGEYWPGDDVRIRITDDRFPPGRWGEPGLDCTCRLLGLTTSIAANGLESVALILTDPIGQTP